LGTDGSKEETARERGNKDLLERDYFEIKQLDYRSSLVCGKGEVDKVRRNKRGRATRSSTLTFIPWAPGLFGTYRRMHSADVENSQPSWGSKVIHWLCALVVDERGAGVWLGIALRGDVSRVVGGLGRVCIWPELRVISGRECGWVRMSIVRMIGAVFVVVVELQKVVGVHEGRGEGGQR